MLTFYKWRSRYTGMEISEAGKLKALEGENRKLKKLLAETMLDVDAEGIARKKLVTPSLRRRAVTWAIDEKCYSQRRPAGWPACSPRPTAMLRRGRPMVRGGRD
jgi:Transposase